MGRNDFAHIPPSSARTLALWSRATFAQITSILNMSLHVSIFSGLISFLRIISCIHANVPSRRKHLRRRVHRQLQSAAALRSHQVAFQSVVYCSQCRRSVSASQSRLWLLKYRISWSSSSLCNLDSTGWCCADWGHLLVLLVAKLACNSLQSRGFCMILTEKHG